MSEQDVRGCRGMLAAVLHRAIADAMGTDQNWRGEKSSAWEYLLDDVDREMSFIWICRELDLCPIQIRRNIKKLADEKSVTTSRPSYQALAERFVEIPDPDSHQLDPRRMSNAAQRTPN